jgi:hypothetical protein
MLKEEIGRSQQEGKKVRKKNTDSRVNASV